MRFAGIALTVIGSSAFVADAVKQAMQQAESAAAAAPKK
jgi:hypothetical protein